MSFQISKFKLRKNSDLLKKFYCVAEYNARSSNWEIEILIRKHVNEYEKKHGKIVT